MANPVAGWYQDPSGDPAKLRWWDGTRWTDDYADAQPMQQPASQPTAQVPQGDASAQPMGQSAPSQAQPAAGQGQPAAQPQPVQQPTAQQAYQQAPYQNPAQASYSQGQYGQPQASDSTDQTLRLIAFILCILSAISVCWAIIPLAWMIPMTVHCWGLYKGNKPNTVAFGVCTLIFCNLVAGILLLVSTKEK